MNKPTYLSREGLEGLKSELDEMTNVRRVEVAARIHDAKEHGDLSENAEYEDAKNEQAFVEGRIQTLQALIKNATLIDEHHSNDHVQIGSTVTVDGEDGVETFMIVGSTEARRIERSDLQRVAGRSGTARPEEGRQGRRPRPGRRRDLRDHQHQVVAGRTRPSSRHRHPRLRVAASEARSRSMDWADELAASVSGPQVVNDSKTPSGTVHVGSLRGPVILDVIVRALRARGLDTTLLYGVDDLDPMDAQALLTPDAIEREMGGPSPTCPTRRATAMPRTRVTMPARSSPRSPASASSRTGTTG